MRKPSEAAPFSTYPKALAWLYRLQRFGIKLGLENAQRLFADLEAPLRRSCIIHVAGTNGKGSVCAMIDSIGRAAGKRTGLFTSPHLVTFRERISVNGEMITEEAVRKSLTNLSYDVASWETHPTFFEITTALALRHFVDQECDVIVLETGLGGRLDATNAVAADVSVITPIDLDHQKWLGNSLNEIAAEKAGIIKPRTPVVSAPQKREAEDVIRARARACEAPLQFVEASYEDSPIGLRGSHQKLNAAVAVAAVAASELEISEKQIAAGLIAVQWPARFQVFNQRTVIDGAHNPASAAVLTQTWQETFGDEKATIIAATLDDKDTASILRALKPIAAHLILPRIKSERASEPAEVKKLADQAGIAATVSASIPAAIRQAANFSERRLITGSLHFAGEALAHIRGEPAAYEECAQ